MSLELKKRISSTLWRSFGMAFVAALSYVTGIGDIFQVDVKVMINTGVMVFAGIIVSEATKYFNK